MTPQLASALLEYSIPELRNEAKTTARVLAAVPDDQAGYKPHEKNMTAGELVRHIAFSEIWFLQSIIGASFSHPDDSAWASLTPSQVAAAYQEKIPALLDQLSQLSGDHMAQMVQFYTWNLPLASYLNFMSVHSIHHRGQLSVYLRPIGAKVPSIYGGSADEPMTSAEGA